MPITADHGANDLIFPRLGRDLQDKFLGARLELEIPARKLRTILFADEREAMNRSVSIASPGLLRSYSKLYLFVRSQGQGGTDLPVDLVAAVFIGEDLHHANLALRGGWRVCSERQKCGEEQGGKVEENSMALEVHHRLLVIASCRRGCSA